MKEIILNSPSVAEIGRTCVKDGILYLVMSASGCGFMFTGKKLTIDIGCDSDSLNDGHECNFPRMAILINGRASVKKVISSRRESFCIVDSEVPVTVEIRIIKLSEAAYSIAEVYPAITDDGAEIVPSDESGFCIEFIGDSITCGYGVDDANIDSLFSSCAENAMKSYSYLTAEILGARYSMFSASGFGVVSGYTDDGTIHPDEVIPLYYESLGFSLSRIAGERTQDIKWDFGRFVPQLIVINLGTNDWSFCKNDLHRVAEFEERYLKFLEIVRKNNPDAEILCVLGIMETELFPAIERVCRRLGDDHVRFFEQRRQDGTLGYSCNCHPSEDTHRQRAEELCEFIKNTYPQLVGQQ